MAEEHIFKHSPFEPAPKGEDTSNTEQPAPLINRVDFGVPGQKPLEQPGANNKPADTTPRPNDGAKDKPAESTKSSAPFDTKSIYEIKEIFARTQTLEQAMINTCFEKQPDGKLKLKDGKIPDGQGGQIEVSKVLDSLLAQINQGHMVAVTIADTAMQNKEAVIGATMSTKKELETTTDKTQKLQKELADQGITPAVGGYLDAALISRFIDDNKNLTAPQKEKLTTLKDSVEKQAALEAQYRDLRIMQETPILTRQKYAEFLSGVGSPAAEAARISAPNIADKWAKEARTISEALNSPVGRSEFFNKLEDQIRKSRENSLDSVIQEKYLKNPNNPFTLVESAAQKAKEAQENGKLSPQEKDQLLASAKKDMESARAMAAKGFPDVDKDGNELRKQADLIKADRDVLDKKVKDGTATQLELQIQQERELKLVNEAQILDAFRLAKPKVDIAYADFLLNADKNKDSESNRKYARDILMGLRFDENGKAAAAQSGEQFDALVERALNGTVDNRASMVAFNKAMQEYDALKRKAATETKDENIVKDFQQARSKAAEAAQIASRINRDGADDNQRNIRTNLQKQITDEMAKPEAERDMGKVKLLQVAMKPSHQLNAQEKEIAAGLVECMKPEGQANKAIIDKLAGSLKDKSALFDAVSAYSMIQQMEFQKQAVNQARIAMLDIDIAFDKGEKNPLVAEIENDKFGGQFIASMNTLPGHDGRTAWGDIKEATRELGWGESLWKWTKGALKEIAISLASWTVGALAGVGAAALFSWTGPGAIIGGGAVGFAAGAATGSAIRHYVFGDKVTLMSAALDGVSGMTGGVTGTTYAVARGAGTAAIKNVIATQAERGITIGANQTWTAFKAAGVADKVRIAVGGTPFLASFSAATAGSIANRYPTEALTGNYQNAKDWAIGSTTKVAWDVPGNLIGAYFGAKVGGRIETKVLANGGNLYSASARQIGSNFLWYSPAGKNMFGGDMPQARRSEFNAPAYDFLVPKPKDDPNK